MQPTQIILLAAGLGSRLGARGAGAPKAMLEVAGERLIDRALRFAERLGAKERLVVGGFGFDQLQAHLAARDGDPVSLVENPRFREGNLLSLAVALPHAWGDVLLMNVDHLYPAAFARRIAELPREHITALCDHDRSLGPDDMKVESRDGRVVRISKTLETWDLGYVGMTFIPGDWLARYRLEVPRVLERSAGKASVEEVLASLARADEPVVIGDVSGLGWHEIDTPEDLDRTLAALGE